MNRLLTAAIPLCLALPLAAQQPQNATTAWRAFTQAHGQDWTVEWNPATNTPTAIFGPGLALGKGAVGSLTAARAESNAILNRFAALLGRGSSTFVENIGVKVNRVYIFVYDQEFKGLPVISGRADVRIHDVGTVSMFGAAAVAVPDNFITKPQLTKIRARGIGEQHLLGIRHEYAAGVAGPPVKLVIWADTQSQVRTRATLAWEVQIDERPQQSIVGKVYVDARNGTVLQFKNEVFTCSCGERHAATGSTRHADRMHRAAMLRKLSTPAVAKPTILHPRKLALTGKVMAWTNLGILPTSPLTNIPMPRIQVTSSAGSAFTDASGKFSIPYSGTSPVAVTATLQGRHSRRVRVASGTLLSGSTSVTPGTPATIQIGSKTMGELDHSQTSVYWHVDYANVWLRGLLPTATAPMNTISVINPRVNIPSNCNAYYTANTINFYTSGGGCSMTAYQTVILHEWGHGLDAVFGGISQIDGLSEGWGDLLAIYQSRQPELGPGFRVGTVKGIRSGLNNLTYPQSGGVHTKGQTWMGWAWDLRGYLMTSLGSTLGEARAHAIVVASIAADATAQPAAVREVFLLDDDDGNLNNGTPNYLDLEKASLKRKLPYPRRNRSVISSFGTGCPSGPLGAQPCANNSWTQQLTNATTTANKIAILVSTQHLTNLSGIELYAKARTAATRVAVAIHEFDTATTKPGAKVLATGSVTIGTTAAGYRALLTPALLIPQPRVVCIVFDQADKLILPTSPTGSKSLHYEFTSGWSSYQYIHNWQYQLICDLGLKTPRQVTTAGPVIGTTFQTGLRNAAPNRVSVLVLGLSNSQWNSTALPFQYAAPCNLYTSLDLLAFQTTDNNGRATVNLPVPNRTDLISVDFYTQFLVSDPSNAYGLISTNGIAAKIGEY